jgi:hypothetical protein
MPIVSSIIGWLRAGYPDGVPEVDYLPLFALLGSKLTDEQVQEIADELARDGEPNTAGHIQAAINAVTQERPLAVDIARVSARLAAGGWPLADVRSLYIRTNSGASAHCRGFSPPAASPRGRASCGIRAVRGVMRRFPAAFSTRPTKSTR